MPVGIEKFMSDNQDAILNGGDQELANFAKQHLNYQRDKGLDFVGRFNGKYVIGESKFLTDFGGHQNAQFSDTIATLESENVQAVKIAILDGVLYIRGNNKMYRDISTKYTHHHIMSALVLREFLYSI